MSLEVYAVTWLKIEVLYNIASFFCGRFLIVGGCSDLNDSACNPLYTKSPFDGCILINHDYSVD